MVSSEGSNISSIVARLQAVLGKIENPEVRVELGTVILQLQIMGLIEQNTTRVFDVSLEGLQQAYDQNMQVDMSNHDALGWAFVQLTGTVGVLLTGIGRKTT